MYYVLILKKELDMHPKDFGRDLRDKIEAKLKADVEGSIDAVRGCIVAVLQINGLSQGLIRKDSSGLATFEVTYQCCACRPFRGEVMDCLVQSVTKVGFFAQAGPITLFVASQHIPDNYEFDTCDQQYAATDGLLPIKTNAHVRVRVINYKAEQKEIFCIAQMRDDYLGVISAA